MNDYEKDPLIQKDPQKGTVHSKYRPITSLSMMWKFPTAQIRQEIYNLLVICELFPEEQKKMP